MEEVHLHTPGSKDHSSEIPARIRDIVTKSISPLDADKDEAANLIEENQSLQVELSRVEDRLASIRADRQFHSLPAYRVRGQLLLKKVKQVLHESYTYVYFVS